MAIPILPSIATGRAGRLQFNQFGNWQSHNDADFLDKFIGSLAEGNDITDIGNIDSIPNIWAKPLLFKMALFDNPSDNSGFVKGLKDRIIGEWRALLAMFALKDIRHLNLTVEHIDLSSDSSPLAQVFKTLAPHESLDGDSNAWASGIYIIYLNRLPIALTSPLTLISTVADYSEIFKGHLNKPWSNDKSTLTDPITMLTNDDLVALKVWLENLQFNLQSLRNNSKSNSNSALINTLKSCVDSYVDDVEKNIDNDNSGSFSIQDSGLPLYQGMAHLLRDSIKSNVVNTTSAVELVIKSGRANKKLLLVSPEMVREFARQERVAPERLAIWDGLCANDIKEESLQNGPSQIGVVHLNGIEYRRPEDFFQKDIVLIDGGEFPNALEFGGARRLQDANIASILPIKVELAEIFSPEEICQRLTIEYDQNKNTATLTFVFPLTGANGRESKYTFKKTYKDENLIYVFKEIPVVELWPNIRSESWKNYYLYYANYKASEQALADDFYYVAPYSYGKDLSVNMPAGGLANRFTIKMEDIPEALAFTYVAKDGRHYDAGMIFLKKPELVKPQNNLSWKIGVDFGTSATMIYFVDSNGIPKPLVIKPHLFQIMNSGDARTSTFLDFIASESSQHENGSFLSIFHLLNPQASNDILPLQDGHVFMLSSKNAKYFNQLASQIDANLKWQPDPFGRLKTRAFIKQICLQAAVEALANNVSSIDWHFSYPTAFATAQYQSFTSICNQAVAEAENKSVGQVDNVSFYSESAASAYYFNKLDNVATNFVNGAICVDIGAGTTDISIISGRPGRIIFHTSVQFAGRYLFRPIYNNFDLFNLGDSSIQSQIATLGDKEKKQAVIDAAMRDYSQQYIENLPMIMEQTDVKNVLQTSQFALAGLFYYLGKILKALNAANGYYSSDSLPPVFVGGNGSRIFDWLACGRNKVQGNPYFQVIEDILLASSGFADADDFKINLSKDSKVEVASGMLSDMPTNSANFFNPRQIMQDLTTNFKGEYTKDALFAGAEFSMNNQRLHATSFISAEDISQGISVNSAEEFGKFIDLFNNSPDLWADGLIYQGSSLREKKSAKVKQSMLRDIARQADGFYVDQIGQPVGNIFVEPVFIVELKRCLEML